MKARNTLAFFVCIIANNFLICAKINVMPLPIGRKNMFLFGILIKFARSYFFILLIALLLGIVFSSYAVKLAPFSTLFLAAIFFLTALKIDLKKALGYLEYKKMLIVANLFMLIVLPISVYYITRLIFPELALAFLILAAMPAGMTAPLLAEISGGKQSLALVLTVSTSLLAPLTIPFVIKLVAGVAVAVSFYAMFMSLAKVIFIPFILANLIKCFWGKKIKEVSYTFKPISIIFLGFLITGIAAKQADVITGSLRGGEPLKYLALLFVFFIVLHILGYFAIFWRGKEDRVTITVCLTYMNFTLAIYLVDKFFTEPNVVIPVILSVFPWVILLIPFRYLMQKLKLVQSLTN